MATDEAKTSLLQPEANADGEQVPEVYRSLNFRSLQDPYSHNHDTMASRYSTLRADDLDTMLNGGLERFYKKYDHLSRKINLQLPTPEVRFENLSFSVQVPAEVGSHGTVGTHLASIFTPWQKIPMTTKHALHPMSGIIKPGSMTLVLANPGAGKSTFLKAMAGKLQDNASTEIGGEILYSGLKGEEIDLIKLAGLVDQTDNHIPTLTVRETFKFADIIPIKDLAVASEDFNNLFCQSSIYRKTHEAIGKGFNEHQFESPEDFKKAKSVVNLARSKEKSEFGLAFSKTLLESFSISQGTGYIWFGVIVLLAYYFVFTTFNGLALHFIRYEKYKGVTPKALKDNTPDEDDVYIQVKTPGGPDQASPSISIFELFDGLLLLQKGGFTAYFGDLGVDSVKMLEYFASIPGTEEIRPQYNPATYMLEVIGAGIGRDVKDYSIEYKNSELCAKNRERTLELCEVSDDFVRHSTLNYRSIATGFWNQLGQLAKKQQLTYWRNPQYNFMRMFLFPIFAVIFGTTFYQLSADSVKRINSHIGLIYNSMDFIGVVNLMTVLEFGDSQDIISVPSGNTTTDMTVAHYIEITYDFRPDRKYNFMVGLLVIWAVVQIAIYLTLKYVSHLKR
ncbi:hypothetical protein PRNP1_012096 [Phytophthora ramorum]